MEIPRSIDPGSPSNHRSVSPRRRLRRSLARHHFPPARLPAHFTFFHFPASLRQTSTVIQLPLRRRGRSLGCVGGLAVEWGFVKSPLASPPLSPSPRRRPLLSSASLVTPSSSFRRRRPLLIPSSAVHIHLKALRRSVVRFFAVYELVVHLWSSSNSGRRGKTGSRRRNVDQSGRILGEEEDASRPRGGELRVGPPRRRLVRRRREDDP